MPAACATAAGSVCSARLSLLQKLHSESGKRPTRMTGRLAWLRALGDGRCRLLVTASMFYLSSRFRHLLHLVALPGLARLIGCHSYKCQQARASTSFMVFAPELKTAKASRCLNVSDGLVPWPVCRAK